MKVNSFIKILFCLIAFLCVFVKSKAAKSHLKKTGVRNKNKSGRTETFYNGEEAQVDENGDIVYDQEIFEDKELESVESSKDKKG